MRESESERMKMKTVTQTSSDKLFPIIMLLNSTMKCCRRKIYGRPFVSKLWHVIRAVFSHVYLRSFLLCGVFIPKYMTIFLQTRIYMRTKKAHRYGLQTNMCIWDHSRSSYKRHQNYTVGNKPLHVRWSWEVTSVWIKHGCNGRINFKKGLALIHCFAVMMVVGSPKMDLLESVDCLLSDCECMLLPKYWPKHGRKLNCTTPGYNGSVCGLLDSLDQGEAGNTGRILVLESLVLQLQTLLSRWEMLAIVNCSCIVHVYLPYPRIANSFS